MKIYLSSYRVPTPEDLFELLPNPPDETRMAIIVNAKNEPGRLDREEKLHALSNDLGQLGLHGSFLDLMDYMGDSNTLYAELKRYELLYIAGGNSFLLREAIRKSGGDEVIKKLIRQRHIVYVGESAGAVVAGSTLKGIETLDNLAALEGREPIWDGLGLVPVQIVPHVDNPDYSSRAQEIISKADNPKTILALNDNQALVVDGESTRLRQN